MTSTVVAYFRGTIYRLYKTANMGNESSTEKEDSSPSKLKRASGLRRSNSLKDNQTKQPTTSPTKEKTAQRQGMIKRSHTFSPSSMKRPTFLKFDNTSKINKPMKSINISNNEVDNIDSNRNKSLPILHRTSNENIALHKNVSLLDINPIVEEKMSDKQSDSTGSKNFSTSPNTEDEIITPNKRGDIDMEDTDEENKVNNNETATPTIGKVESKHSVDNKNDIDNIKNFESETNIQEIIISEVKDAASTGENIDRDTTVMTEDADQIEPINTINTYLNVNCDETLRSVSVVNDDNINKSDNEVSKQVKKNRPPDLPLEDKKRTITRRKNRYVRRSQSMKSYHELLPKLLSDDGFASITEISKAIEEREIEAGLAYKQKLNRRISDTCLVKEEHVRRSEQFTQMLNDLREKAQRDIKPLSPYAKEFISDRFGTKDNTESHTLERKFKFEKRSGYFDFWLKDHNERIDNLTKALEGDIEMRSLKASFNERCLMVPSRLLLPERPHSVKLPRRHLRDRELNSPSDSSDNEQDSSIESISSNREVKMISPMPPSEHVNKDLRDTKIKIRSHKRSSMISIRSSNEKLDNGSKSEIRFNSGTLRSRSKIAIVRPIQRIEIDVNNNNDISEIIK